MTTSSILIDTGAWYALADEGDSHHAEARSFYPGDGLSRSDFVTTTLIVAETWALLNSRLGRSAALSFWEGLRETSTEIVAVESGDLDLAWRIVVDWSDQDFSVVDCATFTVMERLGISDAFAFDSHFLVYRFGRGRHRAFRRLPR